MARKIDVPQDPGMAYRGQTISNPVTGETITFVQTARDTDGELLVFDVKAAPRFKSPPSTCIPGRKNGSK